MNVTTNKSCAIGSNAFNQRCFVDRHAPSGRCKPADLGRLMFGRKSCLWENNYIERLNGKFRDELLNGEMCYSLKEVPVLIEQSQMPTMYISIRPHSSLTYRLRALRTLMQRAPVDE